MASSFGKGAGRADWLGRNCHTAALPSTPFFAADSPLPPPSGPPCCSPPPYSSSTSALPPRG